MTTNQPLNPEWVERIFLILHGRFGAEFTNKYKIGSLNAKGEDAGLVNAKNTWAQKLGGVKPEYIRNALDVTYERAPNLDMFFAQCKPVHKIEDYKALPAPALSEKGQQYAENVSQFVVKNYQPKTSYTDWIYKIHSDSKKFPQKSLEVALEAAKNLNLNLGVCQ